MSMVKKETKSADGYVNGMNAKALYLTNSFGANPEHQASETLVDVSADFTDPNNPLSPDQTAPDAVFINAYWAKVKGVQVEITDSDDNTILTLGDGVSEFEIMQGMGELYFVDSKQLSDTATGDLKIKTTGNVVDGDFYQILLDVRAVNSGR